MTTQTLARITIGTAVLALSALLLFSERIVPAAKADKPAPRADRTAPTTPTNLVVTAITENTVSLKWNPSTDNSGKFSYRIKVSWLHISASAAEQFVSQTQTTYTVQSLAALGNYSFAIYAVDGSGNRSGDSNLVTANTPGDTIPPSAPSLQATTIAPSQVQLTWTKAVDNRPSYCCTYALTINGSPLTQHINAALAPTGSLSVIIRHLTPGTAYTFRVTAIDYFRNSTASNNASAETWPSIDTTPPTVPTNLHVISLDNSGGEAWLGWTQSTDNTDAQNNIEYEIYVNGVLSPLPVSAGVDFDFVYTLNGLCENTFTVKAVDKSGNTSAASAPLKVQLYPC